MNRNLTALCICTAQLALCFWALPAAVGSEPLSIGKHRQLLLDDRFVQQARGVEFVVHPPRKTGDIIAAQEVGRGLGAVSVLCDGGVYHLWYSCGAWMAYARSSDGINWVKPNLNLLKDDTEAGITAPPNAVVSRGDGEEKYRVGGSMVFLDPNASAAERFKLVSNSEDSNNNWLQILSSPDGIHWRQAYTNVLTFQTNAKPFHLDSQNVIFWDERIQKYTAFFRKNVRYPGPDGRTAGRTRTVARAESRNLANFGTVEEAPVVLEADPELVLASKLPGKERLSLLDTYTSGTIKYPWAENAYLMFPTEYYHYDAHLAEFRDEVPINAGVLDTRFATSRDGIKWRRYDHRPFVALGMKGEFDSKRIYMGYGIVPAKNGHELYMYYLGTSETHGWNRDDRNNRLLTAAGLTPIEPARAISRVVLRRDGFVSVRAPFTGGEFTTPLLRFAGEQLLLNVDTSSAGELRVEILDEQGKPIPNFTLNDCDLIHTANEINRIVKWKGSTSMKDLAGKPVRLRFVMRDVDLYAFQFGERDNL
jgi:hypothetical protein